MNTTKYYEWYHSPGVDMYNGHYGEIFNLFVSDPPAREPNALLAAMATNADTHLAFVHLDPTGHVNVVHRVRRHTPRNGMTDIQDNLDVAILGDVSQSGATYVTLPHTAFHRTNVLDRIPAPDAIADLIAAQPAATQVALPADSAAVTGPPVRSRFCMLIPPSETGSIIYAASSPEGLNPRDLWVNIGAPLYQDNTTRLSCAPFIDWCRMAYAGGITAQNPLQSPIPSPIVPQRRLDDERIALLRQDLPDRFRLPLPPLPPVATAPINFEPIVEALQEWRTDYIDRMDAAATREEARRSQAAAAATTTPAGRWGDSLRRLTRLCNRPESTSPDPVQLPPMWVDMATKGHRVDRGTIQAHLNQVELHSGPGGLSGDLINVPVPLATDLGQLRFIGESPDVYGVGLSIFLVSYPTVQSVTCLRRSVELYDQQMQSSQPLTLTESGQVRDSQKFELPTTYRGVRQVCLVYHCLLVVTLGEEHPVTGHFGLFIQEFSDLIDILSPYLDGQVTRCAGILRQIQLQMYHCLRDVLRGRHAALPEFSSMLMDIKLNRWVVPTIPNVTDPVLPGAHDRNGTAPAAAASVVVYAPLSDLDRVLVPEIPNFNPTAFTKIHGKSPPNDQGVSMCLKYHVKGRCDTACHRGRDHRKHTKIESTRLAAYLAQTKP
jgi:hypothetical protein